MRRTIGLFALTCLYAADSPIAWRAWSDDLFQRAKQQKKLVLLDLEAVWCHWCHVMDETTYRDPIVAGLIAKGYIAVKVDQDSRPDLSNRYEDYGWPATILFDSEGKELAKLSGYLPPERMRATLKAFLDDPRPGPSVVEQKKIDYAATSTLAPALLAALKKDNVDHYDFQHGSWGTIHKFLPSDPAEYAIELAASGDAQGRKMARQTLDGELVLIDPVWGGAYQYSDSGVWTNPHFEKIMTTQATNIRIYALANAAFGEPKYLAASHAVHRYLRNFLRSPQGAFYTSQDADVKQGEHSAEYFALDDAGRRKLGTPRIDRHIYSRENGLAIEAIAVLAAVSGDVQAREDAIRAANWIVANRSLAGGGFRHDQTDASGPFLGDTLAMGRAFLQLYALTADRAWLKHAADAGLFIDTRFKGAPGFVTAASSRICNRDENIQMTRFANLLSHYTGNAAHRRMAGHAMRYLATREIATRRATAGVLLADREMNAPPAHITIVGAKSDPAAQQLYAASLRYPSAYLRIEWFDAAEGALPNADVEYPKLKRAAAFACAAGRCSTPVYEASKIAGVVAKFR